VEQTAPQFMTTTDIAKRIGRDRKVVALDIEKGLLRASKHTPGKGSNPFEYRVNPKDAEEYIANFLSGGRSIRRLLLKAEPAPQFLTAPELAKRTGQHRATISHHVKEGKLPARRGPFPDSNRSGYLISREDAEEYIAKVLNGRHPASTTSAAVETPDLGTTSRCGSCGTTRRSIFGDLDEKTMENYGGYLCMACYQVIRASKRNITLLDNASAYLKRMQERSR